MVSIVWPVKWRHCSPFARVVSLNVQYCPLFNSTGWVHAGHLHDGVLSRGEHWKIGNPPYKFIAPSSYVNMWLSPEIITSHGLSKVLKPSVIMCSASSSFSCMRSGAHSLVLFQLKLSKNTTFCRLVAASVIWVLIQSSCSRPNTLVLLSVNKYERASV